MLRLVGQVLAVLVILCLSTRTWSSETITVVSQRSFAATVQQLKWALGGYGLTRVTTLDYREILKKAGLITKSAIVFDIMRRDWLKTLMSADPALGVVLPVRIYVYERNDGKSVVVYRHLGEDLAHHDNKSVSEFGIRIDAKLDAIVAQAAKVRRSD